MKTFGEKLKEVIDKIQQKKRELIKEIEEIKKEE